MYPAFFNLLGKKCVVIGGGKVAQRKIKSVLELGCEKVLVISPSITPEIEKLHAKRKVEVLRRKYRYGMIPKDAFFVFECTGDIKVSEKVRAECTRKKILLNSATSPHLSDFFVPSILKRGDIVIAISTSGKCSAFAKALRENLENKISLKLAEKLNIVEKIRKNLMRKSDEIEIGSEIHQRDFRNKSGRKGNSRKGEDRKSVKGRELENNCKSGGILKEKGDLSRSVGERKSRKQSEIIEGKSAAEKSVRRKTDYEDRFLLEISRWAIRNQNASKNSFLSYIRKKAKEMKINVDFLWR